MCGARRGPALNPSVWVVLVCVQNAMIYRPGHRRCGNAYLIAFGAVHVFLPHQDSAHDEPTLSSPCSVLTRALEVSLARCVSVLSVQLQNNKLRPLRS